jgi:hypothetical protein
MRNTQCFKNISYGKFVKQAPIFILAKKIQLCKLVAFCFVLSFASHVTSETPRKNKETKTSEW